MATGTREGLPITSPAPPAAPRAQLPQLRVLLRLRRQPDGLRPRLDVRKDDGPPLSLGDDLLRHHDDVAGLKGRALALSRPLDQRCPVVATADLGQAADAYDPHRRRAHRSNARDAEGGA